MLQDIILKDTKPEEIYSAFKGAIRGATLAPNMSYSEYELAEKFGVSRTPVHEAALRLQEEGLLKIIPKKGIVISAITLEDMREIYDVILALESAAASLAAKLAFESRQKLVDDLQTITLKMNTGHLEEWAENDGAFHKKLIEGCGNSRFIKMIGQVNEQSHRARLLTLKLRQDLTSSVSEHMAIIEEIRRGEAENAREAAFFHRERARNEILPLLARLGLNNL